MKNNLTFILAIVMVVFLAVFVLMMSGHVKKTEDAFNGKIAALTKENLHLLEWVQYTEEMLDTQSEANDTLEKERQELKGLCEALKKENERLVALMSFNEQLDRERLKNITLKKRISALEKNSAEQSAKDSVQSQESASVKKGPEASVAGNNSEWDYTAASAAQEISGAVVAVDKKNNFIVINLGQQDNIKEGYLCIVFKDGQEMARGEILSVRRRISAVSIDDMYQKYRISDIKKDYKVVVVERQRAAL